MAPGPCPLRRPLQRCRGRLLRCLPRWGICPAPCALSFAVSAPLLSAPFPPVPALPLPGAASAFDIGLSNMSLDYINITLCVAPSVYKALRRPPLAPCSPLPPHPAETPRPQLHHRQIDHHRLGAHLLLCVQARKAGTIMVSTSPHGLPELVVPSLLFLPPQTKSPFAPPSSRANH